MDNIGIDQMNMIIGLIIYDNTTVQHRYHYTMRHYYHIS
jgi:hypothetical protein